MNYLLFFFISLTYSLQNWAGNILFSHTNYYEPEDVLTLQQIIKSSNGKVRVIGSGHSFGRLVDTSDTIISLKKFNKVRECCKNGEAVVGGGITYAELIGQLENKGWAVPNLASLPHISVVGAAATGTHGSGVNNTGLAQVIKSIKFVDGEGNVRSLSTQSPGIGPVLLGALGPIFEVTLTLVPSFYIKQCVYGPLPWETFYKFHTSILNSAYSVSVFTDFKNEQMTTVWLKNKVEEGDTVCDETFYDAKIINGGVHPLPGFDPAPTTTATPYGKWNQRLTHFRPDQTPSAGEELQAEFFVSREYELEAFKAIAKLVAQDEASRALIQVSEIRVMRSDGYYLSMCRDDVDGCVALHFTLIKNWVLVQPLIESIETALTPFNVRPHWGKLFTFPSSYFQRYYGQQLQDFYKIIREYDSNGKYQNEWIQTYLLTETPIKKDEL